MNLECIRVCAYDWFAGLSLASTAWLRQFGSCKLCCYAHPLLNNTAKANNSLSGIIIATHLFPSSLCHPPFCNKTQATFALKHWSNLLPNLWCMTIMYNKRYGIKKTTRSPYHLQAISLQIARRALMRGKRTATNQEKQRVAPGNYKPWLILCSLALQCWEISELQTLHFILLLLLFLLQCRDIATHAKSSMNTWQCVCVSNLPGVKLHMSGHDPWKFRKSGTQWGWLHCRNVSFFPWPKKIITTNACNVFWGRWGKKSESVHWK